jgi:hypothetical protein
MHRSTKKVEIKHPVFKTQSQRYAEVRDLEWTAAKVANHASLGN